jgi:maltose alpha-D-glucosyltransferase/alpha-amylase
MASRTPPSDVLAAWLSGRRWYATKTRRITALRLEDRVAVGEATLVIAEVTLDDGSRDRYALPLGPPADPRQVADALDDPAFVHAVLALVAAGGQLRGERGELRGVPTAALGALPRDLPARRLGGEQSNTSVALGETIIMKHFRRLAEGVNPEEEMTRFLTERAGFAGTPRLYGHLEYRAPGRGPTTLAVVQELVPGARDGWQWMCAALGAAAERAPAGPPPDAARLRTLSGPTLSALAGLGRLTAALHRALASDGRDPLFAPAPVTPADLAAWSQQVHAQLSAARTVLDVDPLPSGVRPDDGLAGLLGCHKIRIHGDFHLGQTLYREASGEWTIIDFEGEPLRSLAERRAKQAPARDVAGLLRSIDYAAASVVRGTPAAATWAAAWREAARQAFLGAYQAGAQGAVFLPASADALARAVAVFELEKAAYEVVYEANNRPDWVAIPAQGLVSAAARMASGTSSGAAAGAA